MQIESKFETCYYWETIGTYSGAYKANRRIKPQRFVIHSTGASNPYLKRWVNDPEHAGENPNKNYFCGENDTQEVMPHAVFGLTSEEKYAIINILPYEYRCWGCGAGKLGSYNDSAIQIEIAEPYDLEDEDYFNSAMVSVAEWCAKLCLLWNIPISEIYSHKEAAEKGYASNHGDPEHWQKLHNYSMDDFRKEVERRIACENYIGTDNAKVEVNLEGIDKKLYRVQVGAFSTEKAARDYKDSLNQKYGLDCFVVLPK